MSGRVGCCSFCTDENQQINAVARIQKENRSALIGIVIDECCEPVTDAVVALYKVNSCSGRAEAITHTFTDKYGQFCFGPLCPDNTYMLKICKDNVDVKEIQLQCNCSVGRCLGSDDDDDCCDDDERSRRRRRK